ncbi:hypothetical protein Droror1_Dr00019443 [Drosera rotundifolia]
MEMVVLTRAGDGSELKVHVFLDSNELMEWLLWVALRLIDSWFNWCSIWVADYWIDWVRSVRLRFLWLLLAIGVKPLVLRWFPVDSQGAAALGSKIYVSSGLNKEVIYSSLLVLNVGKLQRSDVHTNGEGPCARHSHTMVAHRSRLYVSGEFDGDKALGEKLW